MDNISDIHLKHLLNVWSLYRNNSTKNVHKTLECQMMYEFTGYKSKELFSNKDMYKKNIFLKTCQWCMITWKEGMKTVYIKPEKRPSKDIRHLCRKFSGSYNKFKKKIVKKYKREHNCNYLVVVCHVCRKKSKLLLHKTKNDTDKMETSTQSLTENTKRIKKNKKKPDIFRGLNPQAVMKFHNSINDGGGKNNKKKLSSGNTPTFNNENKNQTKKLITNNEKTNKKKKPSPVLSPFFDIVFD